MCLEKGEFLSKPYVVETKDGRKGTLVDAYGPYADARVSEFMQQVEEIQKKTSSVDSDADRCR